MRVAAVILIGASLLAIVIGALFAENYHPQRPLFHNIREMTIYFGEPIEWRHIDGRLQQVGTGVPRLSFRVIVAFGATGLITGLSLLFCARSTDQTLTSDC